MNKTPFIRSLLSAVLLLFFLTQEQNATAATNNAKTQPINLTAEHGEYDGNTGTATYTGNVVITQGEMRLSGDKVVVRTSGGKVTRIEAWGNLATFHYVANREPPIDGQGKYMTYNVPAATIAIEGNASVRQDKNTTRGDSLSYNLRNEIVTGRRVKMSFMPSS